MDEIVSLHEFVSELCRYWSLDATELEVDRPLEELGIDSLGKLELIVMLEDFGGHEMPDELWSDGVTLRDIYDSYQIYASRDRLNMSDLSGSDSGTISSARELP